MFRIATRGQRLAPIRAKRIALLTAPGGCFELVTCLYDGIQIGVINSEVPHGNGEEGQPSALRPAKLNRL